MGVPEDLRGKDMSALTSEDLRRMRSHLAAKMEGEASVQRQSAPREVSAATTSISEALTLTTPRSTKAMTDKFGISQPDTDVRALLINPNPNPNPNLNPNPNPNPNPHPPAL